MFTKKIMFSIRFHGNLVFHAWNWEQSRNPQFLWYSWLFQRLFSSSYKGIALLKEESAFTNSIWSPLIHHSSKMSLSRDEIYHNWKFCALYQMMVYVSLASQSLFVLYTDFCAWYRLFPEESPFYSLLVSSLSFHIDSSNSSHSQTVSLS